MKLQWILLLGACVVVRAANPPPGYNRFVRIHTQTRMVTQDCSRVMRRLQLNEPGTQNCKYTNTFIVTNPILEQVEAVCINAGTRDFAARDIFTSTQRFSLITCRLSSGTQHPDCVYDGTASTRRIRVSCERDLQNRRILWPTHYEGDVV
uniref:Ribonuclease n=1 Tax=Osmerus mordax TaxID=8014 RepID=C1BKN7_OSMMO|nr:Ribonuclease [Osmerus mordax]